MMTMTHPENDLRRGDVVLVPFPNSDLKTTKTRPVLIVQADDLNTDLPQLVVAMITSRRFRANHPSRVPISAKNEMASESGLLTDSVIMTDNLATVRIEAIIRTIGHINMDEVDDALRSTLAL